MLRVLSQTSQTDVQRYLKRQKRMFVVRRWLRLLVFVVPTVAAGLYYWLIATPRYVSETQFVVRGMTSSRLTGLDALFRTFGISRAIDDANIVHSYIMSRDAVAELERKIGIKAMYAWPQADALSRFPRPWEQDTFEDLHKHYSARVSVVQDTNRGISQVRAQAYSAQDAQRIAAEVLAQAEALVNRLNDRAQSDAVDAAQREVRLSEQRVIDAQLALTAFRNEATLVDPTKSSNSALETITSLSNELSQNQIQLQETLQTAPSSPGIAVMRAKENALRSRIEAERAKLAGDDKALSARVSTYEKLTLVRDLADKSLSAAVLSLETARSEARRQQIYIETIARPSLPDEADEPRRIRMTITVFVTILMGYCVLWILSVGAKEKPH